MAKRRAALDAGQLGFTFDPPAPAREAAALAGLGRVVSTAVARVLKEDERDRWQIAAAMSALLSEEVSLLMLDGYASEAREKHSISAARFLALIAASDRFDILDALLRRIGAAVVVGEEIITAELGHIDRQMAALRQRRRTIETQAKPISRRGQ